MIKLTDILREISENSDEYFLDWDKYDYYVRWSSHIKSDLKRNWSSWSFGMEGIECSVDELQRYIESVLSGDSDYLYISGFELWENDLRRGYEIIPFGEQLGVYTNSHINYFGELYENYWVLIDTVNGSGLAGHILPDTLKTVKEVIKLINDEHFRYDGTGDGDFFDGSAAKIIYSDDQSDFGYHILEVDI